MDIELLYKKIEGTLTTEEERQVDTWLKESSRHKVYFKCLSERHTGKRHYSLSALRFESYRNIFLNKLVQKRHQRLRLYQIRRISYAASILLVIALGGLLYFGVELFPGIEVDNKTAVTEKNDPEHFQDEEGVPKVSNGNVILSTSDDKTYTLQQLKNKSASGAKYDATEGVLSYKEAASSPEEEAAEQFNKLNIQPGAEFCLTLSDGTRVWLNSDTELKYPSVFRGKSRRVWLTGEAYFEVAKDPEHPFYVSAGQVDVRVYGTQFNVNTRYRGKIATTLVNGSVAVIPENTQQERMLTPGHTAEYNPLTQAIKVNNKDIQLYIGWKNGTYHFEDTSLEQFFDEISHWYDIHVVFKDEEMKSESFSGIISRKTSLQQLLKLLEKTNYVGFNISGNTVEIRKKE